MSWSPTYSTEALCPSDWLRWLQCHAGQFKPLAACRKQRLSHRHCCALRLQGIAIWQLFAGVQFFSPLTISLLWAIYNAIPPFLILFYAAVGRVSTPVQML